MEVRKIYNLLRFLFALILIIIIFLLSGCAPPAGTGPDPGALAVLGASSTPAIETHGPTAAPSITPTPTITTLIFAPEADAWVDEDEPGDNEGEDESLMVDGESGTTLETYIRFSVTEISGTVQNALLRIYVKEEEDTDNGPAIYLTDSEWDESEITWNTRPARTSSALDNKQELTGGT